MPSHTQVKPHACCPTGHPGSASAPSYGALQRNATERRRAQKAAQCALEGRLRQAYCRIEKLEAYACSLEMQLAHVGSKCNGAAGLVN